MSLSKQLYLGAILVLIIVFLSTLWINVSNTSHYIDKQLASHARDASTSLGLSIKPFLDDPDAISEIDARMQSIFDPGFYQRATLKTINGKIVIEKINPEKREQVPDWFINIFPLNPPVEFTPIGARWTDTHIIEMVSNPGFAYEKLWESARNSAWMILVLFILIGILASLLLRTITVPIKNAAKQAEQICLGNFVQVTNIPRPIELNLFVKAMNRMSSILQNMFNELSLQTEKYQKFAFIDELSSLENRRAFNNQLESLLAKKEQGANGHLAIIRLSNLDHINKTNGYSAGDEYVKSAAAIIKSVNTDINLKAYRLNGADFAVIFQGSHVEDCQQVVQQLITSFNQTETPSNNIKHINEFAYIGIAPFSVDDSMSDVLTMADAALVKAKSAKTGWIIYNEKDRPQGNVVWKKHIDSILKSGEVKLVAQAIQNKNNNVLYHEIYARFIHPDTQSIIPMAQLVQVAERLNLLDKIDQLVISKAIQQVITEQKFVALNLSTSAIAQPEFCQWLLSKLTEIKSVCQFLTFEISEQSLIHHADSVCNLTQKLKELGCKITIEHFGESTTSFTHLMRIKPDHVKIDGSYSQQIETSTENQLFVQSLVNIAHSLQINVIAELIETDKQKLQLDSLFVDYYQGYFISHPQEWHSRK
ncbi:MAG: EAL domain-containing protein [Colwellia sp.]